MHQRSSPGVQRYLGIRQPSKSSRHLRSDKVNQKSDMDPRLGQQRGARKTPHTSWTAPATSSATLEDVEEASNAQDLVKQLEQKFQAFGEYISVLQQSQQENEAERSETKPKHPKTVEATAASTVTDTDTYRSNDATASDSVRQEGSHLQADQTTYYERPSTPPLPTQNEPSQNHEPSRPHVSQEQVLSRKSAGERCVSASNESSKVRQGNTGSNVEESTTRTPKEKQKHVSIRESPVSIQTGDDLTLSGLSISSHGSKEGSNSAKQIVSSRRRETKEEKLERLRREKEEKENAEIRGKPAINAKSRQLAQRKTKGRSLFDPERDKETQSRKQAKVEELKKEQERKELEELRNRPQINRVRLTSSDFGCFMLLLTIQRFCPHFPELKADTPLS